MGRGTSLSGINRCFPVTDREGRMEGRKEGRKEVQRASYDVEKKTTENAFESSRKEK